MRLVWTGKWTFLDPPVCQHRSCAAVRCFAADRGPCHVVTTNYRPTPLQHYLFPAGGDGLQLVVDEAGSFHETNFQKVRQAGGAVPALTG